MSLTSCIGHLYGTWKPGALSQLSRVGNRDKTVTARHRETPDGEVGTSECCSVMEQIAVENIYRDKSFVRIGHIDHIYVCEKTRLDTNKMKALLQQEWEQNDRRYELLIVDYIGLMDTKGGKSRYEQVSKAAEDLKILAKETNTIVLAATQIHRKGDDYPDEISLHDAKDSGSIENSCGLLLGAWRDKNDARTMCIRVLKNTKGSSQWEPIRADFDGPSMRITEREDYLNDFDEGLD